jgi:hypothetical protein
VRVGVAGLGAALLRAQLLAEVQLVVLVVGAEGKELPERGEKLLDLVGLSVEAVADGLLEKPSGGVVGAVEGLSVLVEKAGGLGLHVPIDVDDVEPTLGLEVNRKLARVRSHVAGEGCEED